MDGKFSDLHIYAVFNISDRTWTEYTQRPTSNPADTNNNHRLSSETYKTHNTLWKKY
jgi:hypothetical protein